MNIGFVEAFMELCSIPFVLDVFDQGPRLCDKCFEQHVLKKLRLCGSGCHKRRGLPCLGQCPPCGAHAAAYDLSDAFALSAWGCEERLRQVWWVPGPKSLLCCYVKCAKFMYFDLNGTLFR